MKFNGTEVYAAMGDQKRFPVPVLKEGQKICFLFNDETTAPDSKTVMIKAGIYVITSVGKGVGDWPVYRFIKDTKNSKYLHAYCQIAIDKAISQGFIEVIND